ncbi:lipase 1-like isoform X2 [Zootermopsis nevadensis]|uniref:lipase 1-like isoform X2 n=1 Tax=Zootermopsis nevadensis TaxID=136037 RepID=UPI000B8E5ADC|nr:lipase 1-like isoform X2 [Zootermopsis nevadensis]
MQIVWQCLCLVVVWILRLSGFVSEAAIPHRYLNTHQLIVKYGYPAETHTVTTEDGYILTMHRIPYSPKSNSTDTKRPVVFLQHGLTGSSADWVILGPNKSVCYMLADKGYDIWLGNSRGNKYSKKHTTLSTKSSKFWDFSWHEMGIYDLPSMIDYVLNRTSHHNLHYIGISMGTTMFFVCTSMKPEYNRKIHLMIALAPTAFMANSKTPLHKLNLMNKSLLPVMFSLIPAGASWKSFVHYFQEMITDSGKFLQYDYENLNMAKYRQPTPPEYNLQAVTAPVALFYGSNDPFADPTDVLKLNNTLPNVVELYRVPWDQFNHIDFIVANDVNPLINDHIIYLMKRFKTLT